MWLAFCCLAAAGSSLLVAQPPLAPVAPTSAPSAGVLLLRNGQVLQGQISQSQDQYRVVLERGEVRVKAIDVELYGRDLADCYLRKRAIIELDNVQDRLNLAQWCLNQRLYEQATWELREAIHLAPAHPRIELLERRLKQAQAEPLPPSSVPVQIEPVPNSADLDRFARTMPAGAIESFSNSIQPFLVNSCSAAGCHGPNSTSRVEWLRIAPGARPSSRRLTLRNLQTTVSLIDYQNPSASPLLNVPMGPHGTSKTAMLTDRHAAMYRQLLAWVYQVAGSPSATSPASVVNHESPLLQQQTPADQAPFGSGNNSIATAGLKTAAAPAATPTPMPPASPPLGPKRGAEPTGYQPRDPFDPQLFNRRYLGEPSK